MRYVEPNSVVTADYAPPKAQCHMQEEATWGLVRTSEKNLKIDGLYHYAESASGSDRTFACGLTADRTRDHQPQPSRTN